MSSTQTSLPSHVGVPLFLKRWLAHPLRMGSVVPSSATLCRHIVRIGMPKDPEGLVLELGAGTGVISKAFLDAGLSPRRLTAVEIDPNLADHLRQSLPNVSVLECDARRLPAMLPLPVRAKIETVICGIPMVLLPLEQQRQFVAAMDAVAPGRGFLHFSYCVTSPLPTEKLGLIGKREVWTPMNFPPASVWRFKPR